MVAGLNAMAEKPAALAINDITASEITQSQIVVKFTTNLPVSSQVRYGLNYDFVNNQKLTSSALNLEPNTTHAVALTNLKPKTSYRYQVLLRDPNTNEKVYSDFLTANTL
jgi:hypothetical protein